MQATYLHSKARCLSLAAAFSLLLNSGWAQAATPSSTPDATKPTSDTEEVIQLSPFVVDSSKDQGYRATSTLAGSRINTNLKDVAQAIEVVTKEFMNDVGATNINDILSYTTNTEGTGNYTATTLSLGRPTDDIANNSATANRIRGLSAADITRDYFYTIGQNVGFDTYNLDQVTINRGPNSVLAGLGSPAGIINYSPQLATFGRDHTEVSYRYGSNGDQRATLNTNQSILKDVLAIRLAAAWSDLGFEQKPAWHHDKRFYTALTYQPWKKTTIRAGYELVKISKNDPNTITPEDDVTQWVALGKPSYNRLTGTVGATLFNDQSGPLVVYDSNHAPQPAYNPGTNYVFNQQNSNNVDIWTAIRMNSNKLIPLNKLNLSPSTNEAKYEAINFSLDQEILPGLNANVAYLHEKIDSGGLNLFRAEYSNYLVDVNMNTITGAANPHYGQTYMQFRGLDNQYTDLNTNEVGRLTLTYNLDLTKTNKWLGKYLLTGFAEDRKTETDHKQWNTKSNDSGANYLQEVSTRYYLGGTDTAQATTTPMQPALVNGYPFLNPNGTASTLTDFYWLKSHTKELTKLSTEALVAQGFFWDDKIVGMYGWRKDTEKSAFTAVVDPGDINSSGYLNAIKPYPPMVEAEGQTRTYGVVFHALKWLSFHYNHANNFIPNAGSQELNGSVTPPPSGLGEDYGFAVNLYDDKLNVKVNWFTLTAANNPYQPANFPVAQWTLPYEELTVLPAIAAYTGISYKQAMAPGLIVGDPRLANAYTAATVAKGVELELTYNVTKNWRIYGNISKQDAKASDIGANLTKFIDERLAYWQSIPAFWSVKYAASAIPAAGWGGQPDGTVSGQGMWNQYSNGYVLAYKSAEGKPSQQLAKWHANVLTNYTFNDGTLKGWNLGAGARYIDAAIIGNPVIKNSSGAVTGLDLDHPYTSPSYVAFDAWVGYTTKIYHNKYVLNIQLNGRDLQESGGFRAIQANSDGTNSVFRIVQPRAWYLTTKIDF